jgi:[ribosomal protein S5]-alanine N-acetyltransferase
MRQEARSHGVSIVTRRLLLRDFVEDDWPEVHAYRSDPEVVRLMLTQQLESPEQTRAWLHNVILESQEQPRPWYALAIVLQAERRVIGQIGIGWSSEYSADDEVGFGSMLRRDAWGQGFATEAARAVVEFGFGRLGAGQVSAWCSEANRASARVLGKAGLRLALREAHLHPKTGQPAVSLKYTIRQGEWHPTPTSHHR